ncbi:LytTR family DNA-binding domain-containing protein [Actinomadura miaoliensis]|uniref:Response regulator transcription factor n=1 Tax=Actinomadura miaoliensis TaxID=430685 RepID=A0ABP7WPU9_9ACTN
MLRVLAVDDEVPALEELVYLLREDPRIERVTGASDAAAALRNLSRMLVSGDRLDAVFLDIRMPGLDGLDFTRLLSGFAAPPVVVFVTAHDNCAVTAYELGALDYLLKPVRPERLAEAVRRVDEAVHRVAAQEEHAVDRPPEDEMVPVELGGRTRLVPRREVTYVEAQGDYVRLHTAEGSYLVRMPLAQLARRWEAAGFIRIHRSTLVALAHITELRFDGGRAAVQVGQELLPVARRHTRQVRDLLVRRFRNADQDGRHGEPGTRRGEPGDRRGEPGDRRGDGGGRGEPGGGRGEPGRRRGDQGGRGGGPGRQGDERGQQGDERGQQGGGPGGRGRRDGDQDGRDDEWGPGGGRGGGHGDD